MDSPRRLLFVACDGNARLLTLDLRRMQRIGAATVGESPDVLAFDPVRRLLYVAAESGDVAMFTEQGRRLVKLGQAKLADNAHTVAGSVLEREVDEVRARIDGDGVRVVCELRLAELH